MTLKYACLLLCPEEHIDTANRACVDITGLPSAANTFSVHNHVVDTVGSRYAIAGVYVSQPECIELQAVSERFDGRVEVLKSHDGEQWIDVVSHADWLKNHGFERPILEDEEDENGE